MKRTIIVILLTMVLVLLLAFFLVARQQTPDAEDTLVAKARAYELGRTF